MIHTYIEVLGYVIVLILSLYMGCTFLNNTNYHTNEFRKEFDQIQDMNKCPQTAMYLDKYHHTFRHYELACVFVGFSMFIFTLCLILAKYSFKISGLNIFSISFISVLLSFYVGVCSYKSQACILYRMCNNGCMNPALKK